MPNGGSDCCATCWFNARNRGKRGIQLYDEPHFCKIRNVAIENPGYTYCANHPHRRPEQDPIPIGPITGNVWTNGSGLGSRREVLVPSPDTEEIRQHLLDLLASLFTVVAEDHYPIGDSVAHQVIWQLGEFRESRASQYLQWISENVPGELGDAAKEAVVKLFEPG